jgi:hypothetical protein
MANHPRRSMKSEVIPGSLSTPSQFSRAWWWKERVTYGDRVFEVTCQSMTGAYEGGHAKAIVEHYLDGTLKKQTVKEITA